MVYNKKLAYILETRVFGQRPNEVLLFMDNPVHKQSARQTNAEKPKKAACSPVRSILTKNGN